MKRGEVWWVNFDLSIGGEIRKQRPAKALYEYEVVLQYFTTGTVINLSKNLVA